jgi:hypothetical protein
MKSDYIFGIHDEVYKHGFVPEPGRVQISNNFMLGTPCIIFKGKEDDDQKDEDLEPSLLRNPKMVAGVVPFFYRGTRGRVSSGSTGAPLKLKPDLSLKLLNRTDIEAMGIDMDKIPRALDFVKDVGPLTLFVENSKSTLKELKDFVKSMYDEHSVAVTLRFFNNEINKFQGKTQTAVTLVDIKDAHPIYNTEKVDGTLVNITMFNEDYLKRNKNVPSHFMELTQIFSKYTENIIEVDGQKICSNQRGNMDEVSGFINNHRALYK